MALITNEELFYDIVDFGKFVCAKNNNVGLVCLRIFFLFTYAATRLVEHC